MNKLMTATAFAAMIAASGAAMAQTAPAPAAAPAAAPASPHTFTANVAVANEYRYRGISQTNFKPAIQGGFDYSHSSGFYVGNWNSNISWISDSYTTTNNNRTANTTAPIEMDFYAGFKKEVGAGITLDGGFLYYYYPGANMPAGNPNTAELYAAISYGPATLKYSHAVSNLFGTATANGYSDSKNSGYLDLSVNYDTGFWGLTVNSHVGYQKVRGTNPGASYADWKLGLTKDFGGGLTLSAAYIDTNAKKANSNSFYVNPEGKNLGRATGVVTLAKTF